MKFVDRTPKRRRNRLKIGYNFLATLPEAMCDELEDEQPEETDAEVTPPEEETLPTSTDTNSSATTQSKSLQTGKLYSVFAELKIAALPIPENLRKRLIEVVRENLDAFAASPTDFGRTSVVCHTFKTGDAKPFRHKLRPIPFTRRQYIEQEVEKLMSVNAITPADPGACPYASRTVFATKKDGTMRMCVEYRDVNAQTVKQLFSTSTN